MYGKKAKITAKLIDLAQLHGFSDVTVAKSAFMEPESRRLEEWLNMGNHGQMSYMERHFDLRTDPERLVPGTKSIVSLSYNYHTGLKQTDPKAPKISMYAYGRDYHKVIRKKLKQILSSLRDEFGDIHGRGFVDSAPVLERDWAKRSGHGWIGKNTMLIHPKRGSYFFLAELFLDVELEYDEPMKDFCGTCRKCIDACPTDAISPEGYLMDGSKCISYLTIELKEAIPEEFKGRMENWMFGCDICQEVCPWNRFSSKHNEGQFEPSNELMEMTEADWNQMSKETFDRLFKGSAVKRTGYEGLQRNIRFLRDSIDN